MFNVFVTETNQTVKWDFGFAALFNLKFTTAVKPDPWLLHFFFGGGGVRAGGARER